MQWPDDSLETLQTAFHADETAAGFGKRRHRQQHVRVLQGVPERGHRDHQFRRLHRAACDSRLRAVEIRLRMQQEIGFARLRQHLAGVQAVHATRVRRCPREIAAHAVGGCAEKPDFRIHNAREFLRQSMQLSRLRMMLGQIPQKDRALAPLGQTLRNLLSRRLDGHPRHRCRHGN